MSSIRKPRIGRRTRIAMIVTALVGILGLAATSALSSATFTASGTGSVDGSTPVVSVSLTDDNQSQGTFVLHFNVMPGKSDAQRFGVTNTGTIPAAVTIGQPVSGESFVPAAGQHPDPSLLKVSIDNYLSVTDALHVPASIPLGTLSPGQTAWYTVRVGLDGSAGNDWQNVHFGVTKVTVTLTQA